MRSLSLSLLVAAPLFAAGCIDTQILGGSTGGSGGGDTSSQTTSEQTTSETTFETTTTTFNWQVGNNGYFARFGYKNGDETLGDFCVAYTLDNQGNPVWWPNGVVNADNVPFSSLDGLNTLSRYIELSGPPVAFGFIHAGSGCTADSVIKTATVPAGYDYFTVLAFPKNGGAVVPWVIGDPVEENGAFSERSGFRIVNATGLPNPINVWGAIGTVEQIGNFPLVDLGTFAFGNSPVEYIDVGGDRLSKLEWHDGGNVVTLFETVGIPGVMIRPRRTFYITGAFDNFFACEDHSTNNQASEWYLGCSGY